MIRHKSIFILLFFAFIAFIGYYWLEYRKLEQVDAAVRAWQEESSNYIAFDYGGISARLGNDAIVLNQVNIIYPVLMSIDKIVVIPTYEQGVLTGLQFLAEGLNFTWPDLSSDLAWQGEMQVDYQYEPDLQQISLQAALEFPEQIYANIKFTLSKILPSVDLVFDYPQVLLDRFQIQLQNQGIIQSIGNGAQGDQMLIDWMNSLATPDQRQSLALFWANNALLTIDFDPDMPVPLYRLTRNPRLLWQHPAIQVKSK